MATLSPANSINWSNENPGVAINVSSIAFATDELMKLTSVALHSFIAVDDARIANDDARSPFVVATANQGTRRRAKKKAIQRCHVSHCPTVHCDAEPLSSYFLLCSSTPVTSGGKIFFKN